MPSEIMAVEAAEARLSIGPLAAVREVVLLAGSVRTDRFHAGIGRSILDLPLDAHRTLLDHWNEQATSVAKRLGREQLTVRVMLDAEAPLPNVPRMRGKPGVPGKPGAPNGDRRGDGPVVFSAERDPCDYRGTGGVLRDLADAYYQDDDYLIVANGAQCIAGSLVDHVQRLAAAGGDVVLVGHRDGTPSGLMLLHCRVLRLISRTGFVDMKEQALPMIARTHTVRVVHYDQPTGQPVRTLPDYLAAVRLHHRQLADRPVERDAFSEDLRPTFRVVEAGAHVEEGALLHDSVVLSGASVQADAVLVRSVIGPGAQVRRGQRVVDRLIAGPNRTRAAGGDAS